MDLAVAAIGPCAALQLDREETRKGICLQLPNGNASECCNNTPPPTNSGMLKAIASIVFYGVFADFCRNPNPFSIPGRVAISKR
jgi:hypothetical protein